MEVQLIYIDKSLFYFQNHTFYTQTNHQFKTSFEKEKHIQ